MAKIEAANRPCMSEAILGMRSPLTARPLCQYRWQRGTCRVFQVLCSGPERGGGGEREKGRGARDKASSLEPGRRRANGHPRFAGLTAFSHEVPCCDFSCDVAPVRPAPLLNEGPKIRIPLEELSGCHDDRTDISWRNSAQRGQDRLSLTRESGEAEAGAHHDARL